MKKLFAIIVATLLVCGLCVAPVFADEFKSDCDQSTEAAAQAQLEKAKSEVPEGAIIDDYGIYHTYYSTSGGTYTAGMSKETVQKHTDKYGMYPGKVIESMYETWAPIPGTQEYIDDLVMSEKIGFTYHVTFTDGSKGEYTTYQIYKYIYPKYGYWIKWHMPDPEPVVQDPVDPVTPPVTPVDIVDPNEEPWQPEEETPASDDPVNPGPQVDPDPVVPDPVDPDPVDPVIPEEPATPAPVDPVIPEEPNNDGPNVSPVGPEPEPAPVVSVDVAIPDTTEQVAEVIISNTASPVGQQYYLPKTGDHLGDLDSIIAIICALCFGVIILGLGYRLDNKE